MAIKPPSAIERVSGNSATVIGSATLAAIDGSALTALLPVLGTTLASERHRARVESAIAEINQQLAAQGDKLRQMSDAQYKLINETVLTVFHTTCDEKVKYLKTVINNSLNLDDLKLHDATELARLLRDISAAEVDFLIRYFHHENVMIILPSQAMLKDSYGNEPHYESVLFLDMHSNEGRVALGLSSLGIVARAGERVMDNSLLKFMPITAKLIALLQKPKD